MKIAMLTNNYKPFLGGVPISVERQAKELVKLGHEVTVFAPEYDGELPEGEDHLTKMGSGSCAIGHRRDVWRTGWSIRD